VQTLYNGLVGVVLSCDFVRRYPGLTFWPLFLCSVTSWSRKFSAPLGTVLLYFLYAGDAFLLKNSTQNHSFIHLLKSETVLHRPLQQHRGIFCYHKLICADVNIWHLTY